MKELQELIGLANMALPGAWEVAVRQSYVWGILFMVMAGTTGFFSVLCFINAKKLGDESEGGFECVSLCLLVFTVGSLIIGICYLVNPEYWAMLSFKP